MTCIWNKNFTNNTRRFKTRFPELYEILLPHFESVSKFLSQNEENCTVEKDINILNKIFPFWNFSFSKDNNLTVKENGVFLHSGYSPIKEVQKLFNCSEAKDEDINWIFAGIGLGYAPVEFAKINASNLIVIIEPDPGFLFASMCALDWTPIFSHE